MTRDPIDPLVAFAELGRTKFSEVSLSDVLGRVVSLAGRTVPGAAEVSITLVGDRGPYTAAFEGEAVLGLDQLQYDAGGGPGLQAAAEQSAVSVPDTAEDPRWSGWPAKAAAAGMCSVLSVGLPILDDVTGALNVYGRAGHAFDGDATTLAQTFASYAAVALANAHQFYSAVALARHLQAAMDSRAVIEQAKGIVMAQRRCSAEEAFGFLTKVSQDSNTKVRDVSAALVLNTSRATR